MLNHILWLLFSFKGRLARLGYFAGWLALALSGGVLHAATLGQWLRPGAERPDAFLLLIQAALGLVIAWGHLAIQVKRFHDFNWSGWWVLAPGAAIVGLVVTWIAGIASTYGGGGHGDASTIFGLGLLTMAAVGFIAIVSLMLFFRGGTVGPNDYGPQSGPPDAEARDGDWAKRILDDPLAAAERLRAKEPPMGRASVATSSQPRAAASGERVFGRRNAGA